MAKYVHAITGEAMPADVKERVKSTRVRQLANGVLVTEKEIISKHYLKRRCIAFSEIVWAFRQVASGTVKIGLSQGVMSENRVVLYTAPGQSTMVVFDHAEPADELLKIIGKKNPACAVGCTAENKLRFGYTND